MSNLITPCLFVAHGSPMNAIQQNDYTIKLNEIGNNLKEKTKAIICFSAHWQTEGLYISGAEQLKTIYDFSGFPQELYKINYSPKGDQELTVKVKNILENYQAQIDYQRGIDHGAWSILTHLFPKADIPVVLISQNLNFKLAEHYAIGEALKLLRNEGILFIASGNIVHSFFSYSEDIAAPSPDWALDFDSKMKEAIITKDHNSIIRYRRIYGKSAKLSVPTEEHFIPLLYILGLRNEFDNLNFFYEKFQNSGMSMRSFLLS